MDVIYYSNKQDFIDALNYTILYIPAEIVQIIWDYENAIDSRLLWYCNSTGKSIDRNKPDSYIHYMCNHMYINKSICYGWNTICPRKCVTYPTLKDLYILDDGCYPNQILSHTNLKLIFSKRDIIQIKSNCNLYKIKYIFSKNLFYNLKGITSDNIPIDTVRAWGYDELNKLFDDVNWNTGPVIFENNICYHNKYFRYIDNNNQQYSNYPDKNNKLYSSDFICNFILQLRSYDWKHDKDYCYLNTINGEIYVYQPLGAKKLIKCKKNSSYLIPCYTAPYPFRTPEQASDYLVYAKNNNVMFEFYISCVTNERFYIYTEGVLFP